MGTLDPPVTPSDRRFETPDPARFEAPAPRRRRAWSIPLIVLSAYLLRFELHSVPAKGWGAAAAALAAAGLWVWEFVDARRRRDERESEDHFSSTRVTR